VGPLTFDVHEKPDAAGVALVRRVIEPLWGELSFVMHRRFINQIEQNSERNFVIGVMRTASSPDHPARMTLQNRPENVDSAYPPPSGHNFRRGATTSSMRFISTTARGSRLAFRCTHPVSRRSV
jgi:hypothetical protein